MPEKYARDVTVSSLPADPVRLTLRYDAKSPVMFFARWTAPLRLLPVVRPTQRVFARDIMAGVATKHGLKVMDLTGPSRTKIFVAARHEAMWSIRKNTPLSFPQIGRMFGGRDHTTAIHGVKRHEERLALGLAE